MGKYIAIGDCNKKYFIIFIIFLITDAIKFFFKYYADIDAPNGGKFINNKLLAPTLTYIGQFLCFIPLMISKKCYYKKFLDSNKNKKGSLEIKYLFNNQNNRITFKDIILIIIICIFLLINDFINILYYYIFNFEGILLIQKSYFIEYILLFLMSKYFFKLNYYKHQNYAIIFIILFGLFQGLYKIFNKADLLGYGFIIFALLLQIAMAFIDSFIIGNVKILMESNFLSSYHICSTFGLINGLISIISYFIVTNIPCKAKFCNLVYNKEKYFDNIYSVFNNLSSIEIFFFIYTILKSGICQILIYTIINDFTVCHIFLFYEVLEFEGNFSVIHLFFKYHIFNNLGVYIFIISDILEIFMVLIFLEIVELRFCGLSYNTKRNIEERALTELNISTEIIALPEENDLVDEKIE